ncbi:acetoacetyl-CoA synthetase [Williamsia limnetica]|uniref:Acetoacetyl-CoA synthetase n=1 Tax=Williamsia limnetica TaxID=882452 RepID=A0A318RML9_WILLI|nr:acetoacetate--CoA ligase [Williamsia limnetica]PYE12470.1 acetoacetyl-CoA synthetase [Williamsia limnetica]
MSETSVSTDVLWAPTAKRRAASRMAVFQRWVDDTKGVKTTDYQSLWKWSVSDVGDFWSAIWEFFDVKASVAPTDVVAVSAMPGARWFEGARLNWAENLLRAAATRPDDVAIKAVSEDGLTVATTWSKLEQQTANLADWLRTEGVGPGDRVAAVLPNIAQTVVALLATASVGAIWTCCAPDFGSKGIIDRLEQTRPKVLIGVDGYIYNGKKVGRLDVFAEVATALTAEKVILVRNLNDETSTFDGVTEFAHLVEGEASPHYEQVPFDHPLWILYSSGTTGKPKGIVHSHGGILLESLKANALHYDLDESDNVLIAANTAWVVWNMLVDSMFSGASIVVYDGSPTAAGPDTMFRLISEHEVTRFGTGAAYLTLCERAGATPGQDYDLVGLRSILSTGSPLPQSTYRWIYSAVSADVHLGSDSGGTDVATAFVGANPFDPVRVGELQGACLGCDVQAWDSEGQPVVGAVGEMVITQPMPSMPVSLWNDADGGRYRDSYFDMYPGVWRQGDWITIHESGASEIHGRSDSTINRGGVRMGSSDIYDAIEALPEVAASLVIGAELPDGGYFMPLFVSLIEDVELTEALVDSIKQSIRQGVSPRHVPDVIVSAPGIPLTRTGKRLEVPIKRLFQGAPVASAVNPATVLDTEILQWYIDYVEKYRAETLNVSGSVGSGDPQVSSPR